MYIYIYVFIITWYPVNIQLWPPDRASMSSMPLATACACKRVFTSPGCSAKWEKIQGKQWRGNPWFFSGFLSGKKWLVLWLLCYWVSSYEMTSVDCFKGKNHQKSWILPQQLPICGQITTILTPKNWEVNIVSHYFNIIFWVFFVYTLHYFDSQLFWGWITIILKQQIRNLMSNTAKMWTSSPDPK